MNEFRAIISGRVQMVMFRDFACRKARKLGLSGVVRNLEDGKVEVIAQGERASLEALLQELSVGPLLAKVANVEVEWREGTREYAGFEIAY